MFDICSNIFAVEAVKEIVARVHNTARMAEDEFERMVAGILRSNAQLGTIVPQRRLENDDLIRYSRAFPPARATPASILDDILAEIAAAAIDAREEPKAHHGPSTSGLCVEPQAMRVPPTPMTAPRPPAERIEGLGSNPCPICFEPTVRSQYSLIAPCFHSFCYDCIRRWLRVGISQGKPGTCPTCRAASVALIFSIRSAGHYRYRLLTDEAPALVGDLEPSISGEGCSAAPAPPAVQSLSTAAPTNEIGLGRGYR